MTTIKVTCPECGEVKITANDVELRVCTVEELSFYIFDCSNCGGEYRKSADNRIIQLLISAGVSHVLWEYPEEVYERHSGPTITLDDIIDLHEEMKDLNLLERLKSMT